MEFIEDLSPRLTEAEMTQAFAGVWDRWIDKKEAKGIHGTLFYQLEKKKRCYPTKRETDLDGPIRMRVGPLHLRPTT